MLRLRRVADIALAGGAALKTQGRGALLPHGGLGSRQIPPTGVSDFFVEVAGDWLILYYYARVIRKQQLADWCEKMYAVTQRLMSNVKAA